MLNIKPSYNQLQLLLKLEIADVPIFRSVIKTLYSCGISPTKKLSYAVIKSAIKKISQIIVFI